MIKFVGNPKLLDCCEVVTIQDVVDYCNSVNIIAVDTETSSLDPHQADLIGISLCSKIGKACYIPINHINGKNLNEQKVLKILEIQLFIHLILGDYWQVRVSEVILRKDLKN